VPAAIGGIVVATFYTFYLDEFVFLFEPIGQTSLYKPTDGDVLGHVAFSVTNLDAWHERARMAARSGAKLDHTEMLES
jgi:hypothetical protein